MNQKIEDLVWTEKYRPTTFKDLVLEESQKKVLMNTISKPKQTPNLLFYSVQPGTGKNSCVNVVEKFLECDILKVRASKERGIDTIRDIGIFAQTKSFNLKTKRLVLLNEADGLTTAAQDALKDLMEDYSSNIFFILTTNKINRIAPPIQSRCMKFNFSTPPKDQILETLDMISFKENLNLKTEELKKLVESQYPDIRKMLVKLQKVSLGYSINDLLESEQLFENLIQAIKKEEFNKIKEIVLSGKLVLIEFIDFIFFKIVQIGRSYNNISSACQSLCKMEQYLNQNVDEKIIFFAYLDELKKMFK